MDTTQDKRNAAKTEMQQHVKQLFIQTVFSSHPYRMGLYMATGTGKTLAALQCAMWYLDNVKDGQVLFVCHSEDSRDRGMPKELKQYCAHHRIYHQIKFICYKSLPKEARNTYAFVIYDEAHYLTPSNSRYIGTMVVGGVIVMTAEKPPQHTKRALMNNLTGGNEFYLPVDEAVRRGIVNPYKIFVVNLDLDDEVPYLKGFKSDGDRLYTEREAYLRLCSYLQSIKDAQKMDMLGQVYGLLMRFMGSCRTKTFAAEYMMDQFEKANRRFIVFASSIIQADYLGDDQVMHSDTDNSALVNMIEDRADWMVSINQLREGTNVPKLERIIVTQVNTNYVHAVQFTGRTLRLMLEDTSHAIFLSLNDTFDGGFIRQALSKFNALNIQHIHLQKDLYWQDNANYPYVKFV